MHCAFFYKGILYDIDGVVEDIDAFHVATPVDLDYLNDEKFFGRSEIRFDGKKPSDALIENLQECRIEQLIEDCRNVEENLDYYTKKQKQIEQ